MLLLLIFWMIIKKNSLVIPQLNFINAAIMLKYIAGAGYGATMCVWCLVYGTALLFLCQIGPKKLDDFMVVFRLANYANTPGCTIHKTLIEKMTI